MYLEQIDIEKVLQNRSSLAADGSDLIFDYADEGLFHAEERRVQNMIAMAKAGGEEFKIVSSREGTIGCQPLNI